jgi:hypothetical protein
VSAQQAGRYVAQVGDRYRVSKNVTAVSQFLLSIAEGILSQPVQLRATRLASAT